MVARRSPCLPEAAGGGSGPRGDDRGRSLQLALPHQPMTRRGSITPMTLGNMRAKGVRSLIVYCSACPPIVVLNIDAYPESAPVPAFGPRMVCMGCGMIGADARPNWQERRGSGAIWRG